MTKDLIERLRAGWGGDFTGGYATYEDLDQAATLLEHQAALLAEAREALDSIIQSTHGERSLIARHVNSIAFRARTILKAMEAG